MESSEKLIPLLRRPESSGIDAIDAECFSFTKPALHKPFSLRNVSKQTHVTQPAIENPESAKEAANRETGPDRQQLQRDPAGKEAMPHSGTPPSQHLLQRSARRLSTAANSGKESGSCSVTGNPNQSPTQQQAGGLDAQLNERTTADMPRGISGPAARISDPSQDVVDDTEKASEAGPALPKSPPRQKPRREKQGVFEKPSSRVPLRPIRCQPQASKRNNTSEKGASVIAHAPVDGKKNNVQLSEDDLFGLLIARVKQREESEQAATLIQQQMQKNNEILKEENLSLQDQLKTCQGQLAKTSSESRSQRAQIDKWKTKLGVLQGVLNEVGREYGRVQEQARELKEASVSLGREKDEIQSSLDKIRLQLSERLEGQRNKLSNSEETVARLREALDHSKEREDLIKTQLSNEKKRIITLETYIQNESQSQARYMALVRNDQRKMSEKLNSACELYATSCVKSQENILSKLGPALENCVGSVEGLKEQFSTERVDSQSLTSSVGEAAARFNSLAAQVSSDVDRSTEMNKHVFQALQDALQAIETNLGPNSSIFTQLANSESCYGNLQRQLQVVEPTLSSLGASVKAVESTETELMRGLEMFGQKLSEAQIPAGNPTLEMEISNKFAENTQLQLRLQETSFEIETLRKQLAKTSSENQHLQDVLTETATNEQTFKSKNARLEIEKTALRGELQMLEQRLREELRNDSIKLQNQMTTKFEEQIRELEAEKSGLKRDCDRLQAQVTSIRSSLAETETAADNQRREKDLELQETRKAVTKLTDTCATYATTAKDNEIQLQLLKSSTSALQVENDKLGAQYEQTKERIIELEESLALKTESEISKAKVAQEAEERAKVLEREMAQAKEELALMNEKFTILKARSSALEKVGEESDGEIVSLLRRAQEAESWQATIRAGFAKVIEVHSDEPFEQTWQKLEKILQSSLVQCGATRDGFHPEPQAMGDTDPTGNSNQRLNPGEGKQGDIFKVGDLNQDGKLAEPTQMDQPMSLKVDGPSKSMLKRGDCVDSLPKFPAGFGNIVPFSSVHDVHDRLSREDSLSLFNDPAELEMLFMSTPDLQGGSTPGEALKKAQETRTLPGQSLTRSRDTMETSAALERQHVGTVGTIDSASERPQSEIEKPDESAKTEPRNTKHKVVSFEGTQVVTQTEVGRARRMSDTNDNSSGRGSETKEAKKTQKRTYSRLRQSVTQEETSIEATTDVQAANQSMAGTESANNEHASNVNPRPSKRLRNAGKGLERRLSPKGLASGSSRSNAADKGSTTRGRGRRRTRGMMSDTSMEEPANDRKGTDMTSASAKTLAEHVNAKGTTSFK
ncbi:uncharacterized protein N7515_005491 [Penicillium bovifimosum]|uniref:Uncharacterized protein n=1 Tax=Penicillium bovifimosum TaxID=126998 RepID=A0A9W9L089_9EURO|nr:uncharacterized protein N7515_005491 [Penicillium bovifimosum]KAJ5129452.1 hypothetical protein N7515_005491 [Penicillium bovifimosum]